MAGLDIAGGLAGLAGNIISGLSAQNGQQWLQGLLASIYANGGNAQADGRAGYENVFNQLLPLIMAGANGTGALLHGPNGQLAQVTDQINGTNSQIPGLFNSIPNYQAPNQAAAGQLQGTADSLNPLASLMNQVVAGGGWTPQGQQGFDQISKLLNGTLAGTGDSNNVMDELFGTRGTTGFSNMLKDRASDSLNTGGMTPVLNSAFGGANGIVANGGDTANNDILRQFGLDSLTSGGYTPNSQAGSNAALQGVLGGGTTGTNAAIQKRGTELMNREALLPLDMVMSMARDQATGSAIAQGEKMRREALNRGGGPGSTVANGLQNQAFADNADNIARAESDAVGKALLGQQGLQQNEQIAGGQLASSGAGLENSRLGTEGSLLSSLESGATNRYGVGGNLAATANDNETKRLLSALGILPDVQNSANNNMNVLGTLGLGGQNSDTNRLGLGADLMKTLTGNDLSKNQVGLNSLIQLLGNQQQYTLGAGNLTNNIAGNQGDMFTKLMSNALASGQLDLSKIVQLVQAMQGGNQNSIANNNSLANEFYNGVGAGQAAANPWMQYSLGGMNLQGGSTSGSGAASQNPFASLAGGGTNPFSSRGGR